MVGEVYQTFGMVPTAMVLIKILMENKAQQLQLVWEDLEEKLHLQEFFTKVGTVVQKERDPH